MRARTRVDLDSAFLRPSRARIRALKMPDRQGLCGVDAGICRVRLDHINLVSWRNLKCGVSIGIGCRNDSTFLRLCAPAWIDRFDFYTRNHSAGRVLDVDRKMAMGGGLSHKCCGNNSESDRGDPGMCHATRVTHFGGAYKRAPDSVRGALVLPRCSTENPL